MRVAERPAPGPLPFLTAVGINSLKCIDLTKFNFVIYSQLKLGFKQVPEALSLGIFYWVHQGAITVMRL